MKGKKSRAWRKHPVYDELEQLVVAGDSVQNATTGIGTQNDPITHTEPTLDNRLTLYEIEVLCATSKIVGRGVSEVVEDALQGGWWVDDEEAGSWYDDRVEQTDTSFTHIELVNLIGEAATNARRTGAGGLLVVPDTGSLEDPLVPGAGVMNILPYDRWDISVVEYEDDILVKGQYGKGRIFSLTFNKGGVASKSHTVHRDHLIQFPGERIPSLISTATEGFDDSVVQACWDAIRNFLDANNALAGMPRKFETAVLSVAGLASTEMNQEQHNLLVRRMQIAAQTLSQLNMMIVDADSGESFTRQFSAVNGFDVLWDRLAFMVAASFGMAMTKLFGTSPGGLSTDDASGRAAWRARVAGWQTAYLAPALNTLYVRLTGDKPKTIDFKPTEVLTPEEQTRVEESQSRAYVGYHTAKLLSAEEIRAQMKQDGVLSPRNFDKKAFEAFIEAQKQAKEAAMKPPVNPGATPSTPANPANLEGAAAPNNAEAE